MGDGFQFLEIIVFAVIAGFLVLRLRSVLGRRTGNERRRDPFAPPKPETISDKVVQLSPRNGPATVASPPPSGVGVAALKNVDGSFDEAAFLHGARGAFEIVVNSFAAGDTAALQPLLSDAVYRSFADAIRARRAAQEKLETTLLSIKAASIVEAAILGGNAEVTVRFVSDQVNVTRAADGSIVEGDPNQVIEKTDLWTFSRAIKSRDPNWTLVATHNS